MKALVFDSTLAIREAPDPVPGPSQALVEVRAVSVNFGEAAFMSRNLKPGDIPGWDAAGVVRAAAADGSGPPVGTRVVGFGWKGGWAQLRAQDTVELAELPESVDFAEASALPVAAVTALQALRRLGPVIGRRVLVTGASGGVGRFAVQLASLAGAHVIAMSSRGADLTSLGAAEVVSTLDGVGPVFGVLENVGGPLLADAFALLESGGSVQSIGKASLESTTIDFEAERLRGGDRRIEPFVIRAPVGADLAEIVRLLAARRLDPQIGWRGDWSRVSEAIAALLDRKVRGKAVLEIT